MKELQMKFDVEDPRLSAYAVGELEGDERAAVEALIARDADARAFVDELRATARELERELRAQGAPALSAEQRSRIDARMAPPVLVARRGARRFVWAGAIAAGLLAVSGLTWFATQRASSTKSPYTYSLFGEAEVARRPAPTSAAAPGELPASDSGTYRRARGVTPASTAPVYAEKRKFGFVESKLEDSRQPAGSSQREALRGLGYAGGEEQDSAHNTEAYNAIVENAFRLAKDDPLSTFSIDVDTASYSNLRRYLNSGQMPPVDAVRIEELVNYFHYDYPKADGEAPFSVSANVASCPWAPKHKLVQIGLRAQDIDMQQRAPSNLVFLVDVSGSMNSADKLPLLVRSMKMLVENLDGRDRVAIVVYAGNSGLVLPSTTCDFKTIVVNALDALQAGGSTNGGAGIELAYKVAADNFTREGNNRVILCTDGDFNVGVSDQGSLVKLIEEKRKSGVFLSVLGFGTGNTKDATMELLADKGNGNYAYIDSLNEARKVLVHEMGGTLFTVAKDVKLQLEFNPSEVQAWRLIGYENRLLAAQDFNDDTKDAGEIGAGHNVTALYEIVPVGVPLDVSGVDPLRYSTPSQPSAAAASGELLNLKLRYKKPDGDTSQLITTPVRDSGHSWQKSSADFKFASAVASFGMVMRKSANVGTFTLNDALNLATQGVGDDVGGYRGEFVSLIRKAIEIAGGGVVLETGYSEGGKTKR